MHEVGDRTVFGYVIYSCDEITMSDDWIDYVFVNRRKDGRFSLKAYKWGESFANTPRKIWIPIDSVIGIKTADKFLNALSRLEGSLCVDVDRDQAIQVVRTLDPKMADELDKEWNQ